jgi:hypothetical protein
MCCNRVIVLINDSCNVFLKVCPHVNILMKVNNRRTTCRVEANEVKDNDK